MIQPNKGYVIVKLDDVTETAGGLSLPQKASEAPVTGVILSSGQELGFGTRVWMRKYAGQTITEKGVDLQVVHEDDIIAYESEKE